MGLAYVCLSLCVCVEGVFPLAQSGKTSIFEDGRDVRLSEMQACLLCWMVTSVCVGVGVFGYVRRVLGFGWVDAGLFLCTAEEVCVIGETRMLYFCWCVLFLI